MKKAIVIPLFIATAITITILKKSAIFATPQKSVASTQKLQNPVCREIVYNMIVSSSDEINMKNEYKNICSIFSTQDRANLSEPIWIDASVIEAISAATIDQTKNYDGIRMILAAKNNGPKKNRLTLLLVPTISDSGKHKNRWDIIPFNGPNPEFRHFSLSEEIAENYYGLYRKKYRKQTNINDHNTAGNGKKLSESVWFHKCLFQYLADTIKNMATPKFDGMRVYPAAYSTMHPQSGQAYDQQSTVIIVMTRSDGAGGHIDVPDAFNEDRKIYYSNKEKMAGLNHGQICPNECN